MRYLDPSLSLSCSEEELLKYASALGLSYDDVGVPLEKLSAGDVVVTGPWTDWSWLPPHVGIEVHPDGTPPSDRTEPIIVALHERGVPVGFRTKAPGPRSKYYEAFNDAVKWVDEVASKVVRESRVTVGQGHAPFEVVSEVERAREAIVSLHGKPYAFDLETDNLDVRKVSRVGIALADSVNSWWIRDTVADAVLPELCRLLTDPSSEGRASNAPYDLRVLAIRCGLEPTATLPKDTQPMHWVWNGGQNFGNDLKSITRKLLNRDVMTFDDAGGPEHFWEQPPEVQALYAAAGDTRNSYDLVDTLEPGLRERGLYDLYENIERPVTPVLAEMELEGLRIDRRALFSLCDEYTQRRDSILAELRGFGFTGTPTNDGHIAHYLYEELDLPVLERTPKLQRGKVAVDILRRLSLLRESNKQVRKFLRVLELFIEYSEVDKALSTFLYPPLVSLSDHIYASVKQTSTITGRISTSDPNIMNIPSRAGEKIRNMIIPPDGHVLFDADYAQIEPRIGAHVSQDKSLLRDFREGRDVYISLGEDMGYGTLQKSDPLRQNLKITFLAWLYLTSAPKIQEIALREGRFIPLKEAQHFSDGITRVRSGYVSWRNRLIAETRQRGYVEDPIFGRKRFVRGMQHIDPGSRNAAERETVNFPNQAGAGGLIKGAMPSVQQLHKSAGGSLINQVHDELLGHVPDMPESQREEFKHEAQKRMAWMELSVPIKAEAGYGYTWLEAKKAAA